MARIIVALQNMSDDDIMFYARELRGKIWGVKLNDRLKGDLKIFDDIKAYGHKIMADAKIFEIDNDTENIFRRLIKHGADIVTVHMSADWVVPQDLRENAVGVTVLTNFDDARCKKIYNAEVSVRIYGFVDAAINYGYKYIVCSAKDLRDKAINHFIKVGNLLPICPSIRLSNAIVSNDDQKRTATPTEAIEWGAELLVIGRPIIKASDPIAVVDEINGEICRAVRGSERYPHGN